jgi:hypothetical protein
MWRIPLKEEIDVAKPLFEEIDISAIPKQHKGNFNPLYDKVLNEFMKVTSKAIRLECERFNAKSDNVVHTFRMKIQERKLDIIVRVDKSLGCVYLIKRWSAIASQT